MGDKTDFDTRHNQISKDVQGSNNSVPLSPQWLLPKPGESKAGIVTGDNLLSSHPGYAIRSELAKFPGMGDDMQHDNQKKKDVFRPSVLDMEPGRRDRWRDEERDTNSAVRRDRWREVDKELGDNNSRKVDRWSDSSGRQHHGEARRAPAERWTDSGNRDGNQDQRRESKWNTRWGPDDKEADAVREKWSNHPSKDAEVHLEKSPGLAYHGKEPWRSNSSYSRGRPEPPNQAVTTPNKQVPTFSHGRGREDGGTSTFSLGRGRALPGGSPINDDSHLQSLGSFSERSERSESIRYSRIKMLDVYRVTDMASCWKILDGIVQVPSITQDEPLEPLALCVPSPEELVILKGIDKGDVLSSGAPQITKDGTTGRNTTDYTQQRRGYLGSREDLSLDDSRDESVDNAKGGYFNHPEGSSFEKLHSYGSNSKAETKQSFERFSDPKGSVEGSVPYRENESGNKDPSTPGRSPVPHGGIWRSSSIGARSHMVGNDAREMQTDVRSKMSDFGWAHATKDQSIEWERDLADPSYTKNEGSKWQFGDDPILKRQLSTAPEDLVLLYKDPQGLVQGPFSGSDIIGWFEAGYFGIDLQVRLAAAPDSPFSPLGDVMPHLRAKARPPPGFGAPKPGADAPGGLNLNSFTKLNTGSPEIDMLKTELNYKHGSATEAENRFLESLMSGKVGHSPLEKFPQSEGFAPYGANSSGAVPPNVAESGDNLYLLAKKMSLERQRSLSKPFPLWPGNPNADAIQDPLPHSKLPLMAENIRQQLPHNQNVDLIALLQDRSAGITSSASGWSNFPVQEPLQERMDMHQGQSFGMQQQRLLPQSQPVANLIAQPMDTTSTILAAEKLLASGVQDPQLLNLLQQQYLLQLQSQAAQAPQQLSLLDKLLMIKQQQQQQQKQEEQQQLLRQQQQLLSQVLSDQQHPHRFGEQPYGKFPPVGISAGNASVDPARFQPSHNLFSVGAQVQPPVMEEVHASNFVLPQSISLDGSDNSSLHLPHQMFGDSSNQNWGLVEQNDDIQSMIPKMSTEVVAGKHPLEGSENNEPQTMTTSQIASHFPQVQLVEKSVIPSVPTAVDGELLEKNEFELPATVGPMEPQDEGLHDGMYATSELKNVETKKKSKKHKSTKGQSVDLTKGVPKLQPSKLLQSDAATADVKSDARFVSGENFLEKRDVKTEIAIADVVEEHPGQKLLSADAAATTSRGHESVETKSETGQVPPASQRAWKPAPGFKPKSLLEIQEEEQRRAQAFAQAQAQAQAEIAVAEVAMSGSSLSVPTPWSGFVANSDKKSVRDTQQDAGNNDLNTNSSDGSIDQKSKKSQLHDVLAQNTPARSGEKEMDFPDMTPVLDNDNFIEAKDTKKSRKKSAKSKGAGAKVSVPAATASEVSVGSSPIDKVKKQPVKEEVLPAIPSGPSLGDFVVWKGEAANPTPNPAPAWSTTDTGKLSKPTSLRDIIQKEKGKKVSSGQQHIPVPTPQKSAPNPPARSSWSAAGSSPGKVASPSPIQINSQAVTNSKNKVEDDLFWGPIDHPKQESKQSEYPQLGGKTTPVKGNAGGSLSKQKSISGKPAERLQSSSPGSAHSYLKGKKDALTKHSEAAGFREWCEDECDRLIGTRDTSILEYCFKQSKSEAKMLLMENLGSYDPDHEFIDKFLNYKDFLPANVFEMAFQGRNDRKVTGSSARDATPVTVGFDQGDSGVQDGATKGKKKGKKGKKLNLSELGFNVVSNRIMMGEIQAVED